MSQIDRFELAHRTVLITGASSGIGRAIAISCARSGARVILQGRNQEQLQATLDALQGVGHEVIRAEMLDMTSVNSLVDQCPTVDGVVFSAGIHGVVPLRMVTHEALTRILQVNYLAPMCITQRMLFKKKINTGGAILFLSSVAALTGKVGVGPYSGSKAALIGSMRPLALEVAKHSIRVNAICPGIVRTPLFSGHEEWLSQEVEATYPLGLGEPEDIAHAAVFFLSDASRKITGSVFNIDGGVPFT